MKRSIGEVYFDPTFFIGEAEKTIGQPALDQTTIVNRRKVKGLLTDEGQKHLNIIIKAVKEAFKCDTVIAKWDKYCGCGSCPCSPGYRIMVGKDVGTTNESKRFIVWINPQGVYDFRKPKNPFTIGCDEVKELETKFGS